MKDPINTALLSYGMSGEIFHAPLVYALPEFKLHTIVERSSKKAVQYYAGIKTARSVDEVLADPEIELVIVNTPNNTHLPFAEAALTAGKHVVVEKPFTVTSEEARSLIHTAEKYNRVLSVFQNRRWDGDFLTVKKVLEERLLGRIAEFEAHYDRFRNYVEPDTWKETVQPGTGIVYNLGSHMIDQAVVLFGQPNYIDARIGARRPSGMVDDFYDIRMEYPSHLVILKSSYLVKEAGPRYCIHGVEGSFIKYGIDPQELDLKNKKQPGSGGWGAEDPSMFGKLNTMLGGKPFEGPIETLPGNYLEYYRMLAAAIRSGGVNPVTPHQAKQVIELIEACYESNNSRSAVKVDKTDKAVRVGQLKNV